MDKSTPLGRPAFLALVAAAAVIPRTAAADSPSELRIGYQKTGPLLVLKGRGTLEKRFASQGVRVTWVEFQSGPPLIEALNAGAIDFGYTGDTPPLFAQAAGVNFVYVAANPSLGRSSGIVVTDTSGIKTPSDLRGKKIAVTKGSSAQNVLVAVLEKAGVRYDEVQPVYVQPADGGAALRAGSVDAWSIWDPFFALAQKYPSVHTLTDAYKIVLTNNFFLASRVFTDRSPGIVRAVVEEAIDVQKWAAANQGELARVLADASGVDFEAEKTSAARADYEIVYITPQVVKEQQAIADTFARLGLLPHQIVVSADVWTPAGKVALGEPALGR